MDLAPRLSSCLITLAVLTACVGAGKATMQPSPSFATTTASLAETPVQPTVIATTVPSSVTTTASLVGTLTNAAITSCPVTLPNGKSPHAIGASGFNHGNEDGTLFTIPWPEGTVIFARDGPGFVGADDSLAMKWPWWRGVPGKLTIAGRRLDAPAPALRAEITEGYGDSGFLPISLIFPTQGCWEVTGKVGNARLTFVTLVVKVPFKFIVFMGSKSGPQGFVSMRTDTSNLPDSLREIISYSGGGELTRESAVGEQAITTPNPAATEQQVTVQGHTGTCVQGALVNQQWQNNADAGTLEWTADGSSYRISHKGLGLRCDDLLSMLNQSP
jgi:hypothetical protein